MRLFMFFFILMTSFSLIATDVSLTPPKGWDYIDDPEQLPQKVRFIYVGSGKSQFSPSINLASEETSLPLDEYLVVARSYHEGLSDTRCKSLGKIETRVGPAQLLQIDRPTQWGNVRFLQAIVVCEHTAYVITATCLQEEFASLSPQLFKSIQSFSIQD